MSIKDKIQLQKNFQKLICPKCGLCKVDKPNPSFCLDIYVGNKNRFLDIMKFIMLLKKNEPESYKSLYSFESFCGLFCNSNPKCPRRTNECSDLLKPISCFIEFSSQRGAILDQKTHMNIWEVFSGIDTYRIGKKYSINPNLFKNFPKKLEKKVKGEVKKIKKSLSKSKVLYSYIEKKKVTTKFFGSDDNKWKEQVNKYLEA